MTASLLDGQLSARVLAFFGSSFREEHRSKLEQAHQQGYALLALDGPGVAEGVARDLPFAVLDGCIGQDSYFSALQRAAHCQKIWFDVAKEEFSTSGVCWPDLDRAAMEGFWKDVMLADALAEYCTRNGVQQFVLLQPSNRDPAFYWARSGVVGSYLEAVLANARVRFRWQDPDDESRWRRFVRRSLSGIRSRTLALRNPSLRAIASHGQDGKHGENVDARLPHGPEIVFVLNRLESFRFTSLIRELEERFPGKVAAICRGPEEETRRLSESCSIPVVNEPRSKPPHPALQQGFLRAYDRCRQTSAGLPWHFALAHLQFHFQYYCRVRWPMLAAALEAWSALWSGLRPKVVLVSSMERAETQAAAQAAISIGVPTLGLPEAGAFRISHQPVLPDRLLYSFATQKFVYEKSGFLPDRLVGCRGLVAENAYETDRSAGVEAGVGWRLLALMNRTDRPHSLAKFVPLGLQAEALRTLGNPPPDIADRISVSIKVHPSHHSSELEFITAACNRLKTCVLPARSELREALEKTDLVVIVNYTGTAMLHALKAGKPIVFLLTQNQSWWRRIDPVNDVFADGATIAECSQEFWDIVRRFFTDSQAAEQMRLRSERFATVNLQEEGLPDMSQTIDSLISPSTS